MRKRIIVAILLALFVFGCKVKVEVATWFHPGYTPGTVTTRNEIVGLWINRKEELKLEIAKTKKKSYEFLFMEGDKISAFHAVLFILDDQLFVDLLPVVEKEEKMSNLFVVPTHIFAKLEIREGSIELAFLDFFWLVNYLKKNPHMAKFIEGDGRVLITEKTKKIQGLLVDFKQNKEAFRITTVLESAHGKPEPEVKPGG